MNLNMFSNKVILINIAIVTTVIIAIIILNTPTTIDYEELITVPNNYTPRPFVEGTPVQTQIKVSYPDEFIIEHAVYTVTDTAVSDVVITTEYQPYPMSPASSILACDDIQPDDTVLVLAVTKTDTAPAVYAIIINDAVRCYFNDPFPTGYNSIVVFTRLDITDNLKVEIRKIKELS